MNHGREQTDLERTVSTDTLRAQPADQTRLTGAPRIPAHGDTGARRRHIGALQREAGNAAAQQATAAPDLPKVSSDGKISGEAFKIEVPKPHVPTPLAPTAPNPFEKSLGGYATVGVSFEATLSWEVALADPTKPRPASGVDIRTPATAAPAAGGGGTKATGSATNGAYEAEVSREFGKVCSEWAGNWVPSAKINRKVGSNESSLGLEGSLSGEQFDPKFAIKLFDAKNGQIEFVQPQISVSLKPLSFAFTDEPGNTYKVSCTPTAKAYLKPDYTKLFKWFMEEAAKRVATELSAGTLDLALPAVVAVGGAALIGLDVIDIDRRVRLTDILRARAIQIIDAQGVYERALMTGEPGTLHPRAAEEGLRARQRLAEKAWVDPSLFSQLGQLPEFAEFGFMVPVMLQLEKKMHEGLDAWAEAHPYRSLWGLRVNDDKQRVTQAINAILDDPIGFRSKRLGAV